MREILFRGKHIHAFSCNNPLDGMWVYGYLVDENYINDKRDLGDGEYLGEMLVDPETVGQFTGLLDKNGTKIFEGDICKSQSGLTYLDGRRAKGESIVTYQIGFCDGHFTEFKLSDNRWKNYNPKEFSPSSIQRSVVEKYFEVIGNIHENNAEVQDAEESAVE